MESTSLQTLTWQFEIFYSPVFLPQYRCRSTVGGEAVTFNTKGWHIEDDIDYVGVDDHEKQDELRQAGYHRLVEQEARETFGT